ncbi:hypothetical protein F2Q69_00031460 [Brassica cretica]|uniref:Uncharacterized protein n=1 Tax=Brassica cretica TaxID=69181 RepID=A0A8S9S3R0_BRACR|nr:hypothetical protein F2Q69_00031460 [Brassica cretica]
MKITNPTNSVGLFIASLELSYELNRLLLGKRWRWISRTPRPRTSLKLQFLRRLFLRHLLGGSIKHVTDDNATFLAKLKDHFPYSSMDVYKTCKKRNGQGRLFVNATSGTHFYLDSETAACRYHVELSISDDKEATVAVSSATLPTGRVVVVVAAAVNAVMVPAAVTVASEAATLSGV